MKRLFCVLLLSAVACEDPIPTDDAGPEDASSTQDAARDVGTVDTGVRQDAAVDAGRDVGPGDQGPTDIGADAGATDTGPDDAGLADTGLNDTGVPPQMLVSCSTITQLDSFAAGDARLPKVDFSGDRVAVIWEQRASVESVAVARYDFNTNAWTQSFNVFEQNNPPFSPVYDVAIDSDGDVTATYRTIAAGVRRMWARTYDVQSSGWGAAELAYDNGSQTGTRHIQYDRSTGTPLIVFEDAVGGRRPAMVVRRNANGTWTQPEVLGPPAQESASDLRFELNDVGQGMAAWLVYGSGGVEVHALPYAAGAFRQDRGGNASALVHSTANPNATALDLAVGATGRALLVFNNSIGQAVSLESLVFDLPETLSATTSFFNMAGANVRTPRGIVSPTGEVSVIWSSPTGIGSNTANGWFSTLEPQGWSSPVQFGMGHASTWPARGASDAAGRVSIVSSQGSQGVHVTRNTGANASFLAEQAVGGMGSTGDVHVIPHASGDFLVVWEGSHSGGPFGIHAARCN